ncbi:MAG: transcription factor S [Halobacteriaceae archaeon]
MQFCEACGSMMVTEEDTMVCTECGRRAERDADRAAAFVSTEEQSTNDVIESDSDANFEGKPRADDVTCEACGNEEAWYTIKQTGAADEPPTRFFKCTECGQRWREYN